MKTYNNFQLDWNINNVSDFNEALEIFKESTNPILSLIRMTILAEAWRSLGDEKYKIQALEALDPLQDQYPRQIAKWRNYLNGKRSFPGLEFWY